MNFERVDEIAIQLAQAIKKQIKTGTGHGVPILPPL
jgi:hypothetical protein